jgi:uncharacterized SAM-dependent methyltransferase
VRVAGETFHFDAGESIWTESSYKYDRPRLDRLIAEGGFRVDQLWTDEEAQFWVALLAVA